MPSNSDNQSNVHAQAKVGVIREYWQTVCDFSPSLQRMLLSMSLILVTAFGLQPVLQNLYLLRLGFDVQFIGLMAGIGQVAWAVAALPASPAAIGSVMGFAQLLPIGAALAVPFLVNRMGTGNALLASMVGIAIVLAVLSATNLVWVVIVTYMIVIAMHTIRNTARDIFGQEVVIARWRTSSQSIAVIGVALGWALAGIGGGAVIQARGFGLLYFIGALTALLGAGVLFGYLRATTTQPVIASEVVVVAVEEPPMH